MTTHALTDKNKLYRIDLRTTGKIKEILVQAAKLAGTSISSFLIGAAYEKAEALLAEQETLKLTNAERDRFITLLETPPPANTYLKKNMQKYLKDRKQ